RKYAPGHDGHWPVLPETWCSAAVRRLCLLLQLRPCAPCQNFWIVLRDQNRVLEMRRGHSIRRAHRPPIVEQSHVGSADVNHRLNRQRHPSFQLRTTAAFPVICNLWLLMHFSSNPVSNEFRYDGKTKAARFILNFSADVANAPAFAGRANSAGQRIFRYAQQLVGTFVNDSHWHSSRVVPYPTIPKDSNIDFYNIAILNPPMAADAVHHFVIERNANVSGKYAVPEAIAEKCAFHMRIAHEVCCPFIDFFCRNARAH